MPTGSGKYVPLSQLIPTQSLFTYSNVVGTAVDIRCPAYVSGVNQAGHHYHFVSDDHKGGGHALSFTTGEVRPGCLTWTKNWSLAF